jgi:hypothetical protein
MSSIWLFRFTSFSWCQGSEDKHYGDMRLLKFSLPCKEWEAKEHLNNLLNSQNIRYLPETIEILSFEITNF